MKRFVLNKRGKLCAKILLHYTDIVIFVLGHPNQVDLANVTLQSHPAQRVICIITGPTLKRLCYSNA